MQNIPRMPGVAMTRHFPAVLPRLSHSFNPQMPTSRMLSTVMPHSILSSRVVASAGCLIYRDARLRGCARTSRRPNSVWKIRCLVGTIQALSCTNPSVQTISGYYSNVDLLEGRIQHTHHRKSMVVTGRSWIAGSGCSRLWDKHGSDLAVKAPNRYRRRCGKYPSKIATVCRFLLATRLDPK